MTIRKKYRDSKDYLKRNNDLQTSLLFVRMFHMKHSDFLFDDVPCETSDFLLMDVSCETLIVTQNKDVMVYLQKCFMKQYERTKNIMITLVCIPGCFT